MGQNQWLHFGADEHPCTTNFDVHQGYRVLTHSHMIRIILFEGPFGKAQLQIWAPLRLMHWAATMVMSQPISIVPLIAVFWSYFPDVGGRWKQTTLVFASVLSAPGEVN